MTARDADKPGSPLSQTAASTLEGGLITKTVGRLRWRLRPGPLPEALHPLLKDPDAHLADPERWLAPGDPRLATLGVIQAPNNGPSLVLRRFNYGRFLHRLRDCFRRTRAERAFRHGLAMEHAGLPTPRVWAVGVERLALWPARAYLITEFVPRTRTLRDLLVTAGRLPAGQCDQLVDLVARLHAAGFSNRDLNAANLLCDERGTFWIIDLDGVRQHRRVPLQRVAKDLERLARNFPAEELARRAHWWLKRYCHKRGLAREFRDLYERARRWRAVMLRRPRRRQG
jgi:tRNA A-37 threonylcarbamoyl transferase component Bud32